MCGICCILRLQRLQCTSDVSFTLCESGAVECVALHESVKRRGPDDFVSLQFNATPSVLVEVACAVLRLRGGNCKSATERQPVMAPIEGLMQENCGDHSMEKNHSGSLLKSDPSLQSSFLQWNGEVFGGILQVSLEESDTTAVFNRLYQLEQKSTAGMRNDTGDFAEDYQVNVIQEAQASFVQLCLHFFEHEVEGPYAFVYYAKTLNFFLFGRDPLGRRSLLMHFAKAPICEDDIELQEEAVSTEHPLEIVIASVTSEHRTENSKVDECTDQGTKRRRYEYSGNGTTENSELETEVIEKEVNTDSAAQNSHCWKEVANTGLFSIKVGISSQESLFSHYPWTMPHTTHPLLRFQTQSLIHSEEKEEEFPEAFKRLLSMDHALSHSFLQEPTSFDTLATIRYLKALWKSVEVRVKPENCGGEPTQPIGVLFSGGIDCTVLAAIMHYVLPTTTPIELINVAFGDTPELTPDRLATFRAFEQLLRLPASIDDVGDPESLKDGREWRLVLVDVPNYSSSLSHVRHLINPRNSVMDVSIGTALWHAAQGRGRMQRVQLNKNLIASIGAKHFPSGHHKLYRMSADNTNPPKEEGTAAVCSGVKETITFDPLIDAIVTELEAFGGEPTAPVLLSTLGKDYATMLRPVLARYGYLKLGKYLNDASTAGVIAFAKNNEVPSKAVRLVRPEDLARVRRVQPEQWLTLDGETCSPLGSCVENYTAQARVLLLGIGADETLGGYTRHRRAFERRGVQGLAAELDLDFSRLWKRNMGRDDRVVCDSGRESRYPYLDERVLATLATVAAEAHRRATASMLDGAAALQQALAPVCCFTSEEGQLGVGDKRILRRCAMLLGLGDVVRLQKRAIQFGSRIAQVSM